MEYITTQIDGFKLRYAVKEDAELIINYIRKLAQYENELEDVFITRDVLEKQMFDEKGANAIIGEYNGEPVGFALFHKTFSTFLGKKGIGLVDLYIDENMRHRGFGKTILAYLAKFTVENDFGRLEWWCHDWNHSAITLYKRWGAFPIDNIRVYRLCDTALLDFIQNL